MSTIEKTVNKIEDRLKKMERLIAEKGVGSDYLSRAERVQRDVNIALFAGAMGLAAGVGIWAWYRLKD